MFAQRLKEVRRQKKLSQIELANRIGVSTITLGAWEQGKCSPKTDGLKRICDALNVSADYLCDIKNDTTLNLAKLSPKEYLCVQEIINHFIERRK